MLIGKRRWAYLIPLIACTHATATTVVVKVSGIEPDGRNVYAALCSGGLNPQSCHFGAGKPATAPVMQFVFDVLPGRYAAAAFQDLNGSGNFAQSKLGLPLEPYGFSNDAGRTRRPSFDAAAFLVEDRQRMVEVRLRRLSQGAAQE